MNGSIGIDVIFFAAIACLLALRLWSILGKKGGPKGGQKGSGQIQRNLKKGAGPAPKTDKVVPLHGKDSYSEEEEEEDLSRHPARDGLLGVQEKMPGFRSDEFLIGARAAFEMIVAAFARGDRALLGSLLAPDVLLGFEEVITAREAVQQTRETNVIGIISADVIKARLADGQAEITVRFVSEQINVTHAEDGAVVEGDPRHVDKITDVWTFARDTASEDPNWLLISTGYDGNA